MAKLKRVTYAYAVVSKRTRHLLQNLKCQYSLWQFKIDAVDDCPDYGKVIRVRISEIDKP